MRSSKFIKISTLSLLIFLPKIAFANETQMFGNWARADGIAKVEVSKCGENYCAKNIWIKPDWKSEKVGDVLIMKIKNKSNSLFVGTAYDPQRKLTLKFQLNVSGDKMTTKGCIAGGLLCKSVGWTRI